MGNCPLVLFGIVVLRNAEIALRRGATRISQLGFSFGQKFRIANNWTVNTSVVCGKKLICE